MSQFELKDKIAIVTGGAGGIGTCISLAYAEAGAHVVVASRKQENLDKVAAKVTALGRKSLAIATDTTDPDQVENMIQKTLDTFGRLDIIVNNAGGGVNIPPARLNLQNWNDQMALNLTGTMLCCVAASKPMIEQRSGKIINISSMAGVALNPNMAPYCAAKAGVISLGRSLAPAYAPYNININTIAPGLTATEGIKRWNVYSETKKDGTPIPRMELPPDPENIADMALFLASPASDHITGELMMVRSLFYIDR